MFSFGSCEDKHLLLFFCFPSYIYSFDLQLIYKQLNGGETKGISIADDNVSIVQL